MAKQATAPLSKEFWTQKGIEHAKKEQEQKLKMQIMVLKESALNGSFKDFENAVGEYVKGMKAIPEMIFYEPLQLAAGSEYDSDQKVAYLLNKYISNVNLEMKVPEGSMTLLGWALTYKKSELVTLLLKKGADPNAVALNHNETGVSYTAVGLVFNDYYQYTLIQSSWLALPMKLLGIMPNPKIDENQVELLVKHGAKISQPAIACGNEAVFIPSQNPLIAQLPCVKTALAIEPGKEVFGNKKTSKGEEPKIQILEDDTEASGDNSNVPQTTATPGEEYRRKTAEADGAFGSGEKPAPAEQPKSWFSKVFSFSWLNFWSSKSGDMQNANTTSAVGVETKNEVPEPDSVDQLGQTPQPKTSWYSGVSKFFGNIGNKVLSLVGLGSEAKHNGAGENSNDVSSISKDPSDLTRLKIEFNGNNMTELGQALQFSNSQEAKKLLNLVANSNDIPPGSSLLGEGFGGMEVIFSDSQLLPKAQ